MTKDVALRDLAWCGNSVYHDDYPQGVYDERCGYCRRMYARLVEARVVVLAPDEEVKIADARSQG